MEIAPSASGERVFVHLGPGPIRDIISSLMYGTGFDYIVEAADDDPDVLRSLVVTVQGKTDDSAGGSLASASGILAGGNEAEATANRVRGSIAQGVPSRDGMRMMRGWAAPGKPAFELDAEAALAAEQTVKQSGSVFDSAEGNVSNAPAAASTSASVSSAEDGNNSNFQPSSSSTDSGTSAKETDLPPAIQEASSSASDSDSNTQPAVNHMIQNMTDMFAQRRQIQSQQNQAPQQQRSPSE